MKPTIDYSNYCYDDLYYALHEAEIRLEYIAMCPKGNETEGFEEAQAEVDAIYMEIWRREDLYE